MEQEYILEVEKNERYNYLLDKAKSYVAKSVNEKSEMTQTEVEDLRINIAAISYMIADEILFDVGKESTYWEIEAEKLEASEFAKYYKYYMKKLNEKKADYTKSSVESFARKTTRMKGKPYSHAHKMYLLAENYKSRIYQLLKALNNLANALSKLSDR